MRIMIIAACMCAASSAHAAIQCQTAKQSDGHWAWREIDGRRCWYRGQPGKPKTQLVWSVTRKASPAPMPLAPPPPASSSRLISLQVTPAPNAPGSDMLRAKQMTDGVPFPATTGAIIPDAVAGKADPPEDACCWPPLDELSFAERWLDVPTLMLKARR